MIHDTRGGCENDKTELTRGQKLYDPFFEIGYADVVSGRYDASFVDSILVSNWH